MAFDQSPPSLRFTCPSIRCGSRSPEMKGQFLGESTCRGMPNDTLPWAVQKWLKQLRCHLGWLWTRVGPRKHGATWWIPLNRPCAAAMRPFCQIVLTTCYYNIPSVWWSRRPMERCRPSSRWQTSAGRSWDHRSLSHESTSADLSTAQSQASFNRLTSIPKHLWLCKVSMQRSLMLNVSIISPLLIIITITIMLFKAS